MKMFNIKISHCLKFKKAKIFRQLKLKTPILFLRERVIKSEDSIILVCSPSLPSILKI